MRKPSPTALLLLAAAILLALAQWRHTTTDTVDAEALRAQIEALNKELKGTQLHLAEKSFQAESLKTVSEAAKLVRGVPVAGLAISIPKRDTVIVHDTVVTEILADSTRIGRFKDSTFAGTISAVIVAPPCCAALRVDSLHVTRPAFRPEVGFVKVGQSYVATVAWQGEKFSLENVFFDEQKVLPKQKHVLRWVEATYVPLGLPGLLEGPVTELRGGAALTMFGFQLGPSAGMRLAVGARPTLGVTLRKEW